MRAVEAVVQSGRDAAARGDWRAAFDLLMEADTGGFAGPAELPLLGEVAYAAGHLDWRSRRGSVLTRSLRAGGRSLSRQPRRRFESRCTCFSTPAHGPGTGLVGTRGHCSTGRTRIPRTRGSRRSVPTSDPDGRPPALARGPGAPSMSARRTGRLCGGAGGRSPAADPGRRRSGGPRAPRGREWPRSHGDLDPLSRGRLLRARLRVSGDSAIRPRRGMDRSHGAVVQGEPIGSVHGRCRIHRAEILRLRGPWTEAEHHALNACDELRPYLRRELGWPLRELGRVRLRKGDSGRGGGVAHSSRAGWDPQPGLRLVHLAKGD